jgi:hypothetical protein
VSRVAAVAALCLAAAAPFAAHASDDESTTTGDSGWLIAPYLWAPNLGGSVGLGALRVPVDVGIDELAGGLRAAAMGYLQYRHGRHFLYVEGLGLRFKDERFAPFFDQSVRAQVSLVELGYGRRYRVELLDPLPGTIHVSPYIGLRHAALDVRIDNPEQSTAADESWIDPALGMIVEIPLRGSWDAVVKLDAAGFGLGRDHYWNAIGMLRYTVDARWSLAGGYRIARFDAEPGGGNDLDLSLRGSGFKLGLTYRF